MFLRYLLDGGEWHHTLLEGAKGIQLAELGLQSWKERRWIDVPPLEI
jgi:predicted dehydrogenase